MTQLSEKNENRKEIELSDYQKTILEKRYFFNNEDWEGLSKRVASLMSMVETKKSLYEEKFSEMIFNMDFLPGGRILRNAGRPRGSLFNCYHLPIGDSREEIGQFLKDSLILWGEGGGVGANFSNLRPRGAPIQGVGGTSSGVVSFIKAANAVAETIESGGQRRAAALAALDVSHPEILDFIDAKTKDKVISSFNISVQVNSEFIEAVELNKDWEFKFKQKIHGSMPARQIWDKIIYNMVNCGEPGLLNMTNFLKNNSYYYDPVIGTNPCLTGDTLINVADGRGFVKFKKLAEEGKDVPVYCRNNKTNEIEIKIMRNPRKTGMSKKILKIIMNNGSYWRGTENHKISNFSGEMIEAENLKINDILNHYLMQKDINNKKIFIKQNKELSFKISRIYFDGYEDVYNGTVDDNHNYFIYMNDSFDNNVKTKNILNVKNCGETCLAAYDSCDLGSLNLPNFITGTKNTNWKKLEEIIKLGVRFLDNVIDVNKYSLNECSIKAQNSRRIGLGIMGLAEYLFLKKFRYGSKESIQEIEKLFRFIRDIVYESSIELSIEKGAFPKFDPVQYGKASFIRKLPAQLRRSIKDHGIRNVSLIAIAPTGTISQIANVSSGIEPLVSKVYLKSDRVSDRLIAHPMFLEYKERGEEIPDWFVDIHDLKPEDHFEVQAIVQKYVDNSVSKTINMPADTTIEQVDKLLLEYIHDLKGVTIYVDKSRSQQVNYYLTKEQINDYLKGKIEVMDIVDTVKCSSGKCDI